MTRVRVNVRTAVNKDKIRRERRNGRDIIIVPSATLPDNVVMNKILYPAEEIEKSYKSLENTPAPLGHPNIEGEFVSASHPEGMVRGFIGAWNSNVRRENGRVFIDKIIDVEYANQSVGGRAVLEAVEKGEPIHTSTGLYGVREEIKNKTKDGPEYVMKNIVFDHDAILLGEHGAATPEQGVGMLVNRAKDPEGGYVDVINSALDRAEDDVDWAGMHLLDSLQRLQRASKWEQVKSSLLSLLSGNVTADKGEGAMNEAQFNEVSGKLDKLAENLDGLAEAIGTAVTNALKPVADSLAEIQNQSKAAEEAKKTELVNKIVKNELLSEAIANTLDIAALTELASRIKEAPGKSAALNTRFNPDNKNVTAFKLPKSEG